MGRTTRESPATISDYADPRSADMYPPLPSEIDPAVQGGYGSYAQATSAPEGYSVDENGHHVQHLPPLSEALHPEEANEHLTSHPHYAHAATTYDTQQHNAEAAAPQNKYDQQSSNFFDSHIMDPPSSSDGTHHQSGIHAAGTNGSSYGASMMTPPPPGSSHGQYSSPYQSAAPGSHLFHRASISGPVMHSHYPPAPGTASSNHSTDLWSTSAAARPHTADGMFGGMPGQWAIPDYNRGPRGSISSMSDAAQTSGSSKVFSYMPSNGDDSSSTAGSVSGHQGSGGPRKRPRRRYDEIERLYNCSWPGCQKSYGTLNHLNAHVAMQKHGPKRSPGEFKEMRKAWRKGKREDEQRRQANQAAANEDAISRSKMVFATPNQPFMTHSGYPVNSFGNSTHSMPPPGSTTAATTGGLAGGQGTQAPRYHPQGGMYTGYSQVGGVDPAGRAYSTGGQSGQQPSGGLGAYLMAHRGSI